MFKIEIDRLGASAGTMVFEINWKHAALAASVLVLAACGGGGSGITGGNSNNTAPAADAGADQTVDERHLFGMSATFADYNVDGRVDIHDLTILAANFGATEPQPWPGTPGSFPT